MAPGLSTETDKCTPWQTSMAPPGWTSEQGPYIHEEPLVRTQYDLRLYTQQLRQELHLRALETLQTLHNLRL